MELEQYLTCWYKELPFSFWELDVRGIGGEMDLHLAVMAGRTSGVSHCSVHLDLRF